MLFRQCQVLQANFLMAKRTGGKEGNGETHRVDRETNMMGLGGMVAEKLTLFFDRMTE